LIGYDGKKAALFTINIEIEPGTLSIFMWIEYYRSSGQEVSIPWSNLKTHVSEILRAGVVYENPDHWWNRLCWDQLTSRLIQDGHEVTVLSRSTKRSGEFLGDLLFAGWSNPKRSLQEAIKNHDAVLNLAGASILPNGRRSIRRRFGKSCEHDSKYRSRNTRPSRKAVDTSLAPLPLAITVFVEMRKLTEASPNGEDFLARMLRNGKGKHWRQGKRGPSLWSLGLALSWEKKGGASVRWSLSLRNISGVRLEVVNNGFRGSTSKTCQKPLLSYWSIRRFSPVKSVPQIRWGIKTCKALGECFTGLLYARSWIYGKTVLGEFGSVILEGQRVIPKRAPGQWLCLSIPRHR